MMHFRKLKTEVTQQEASVWVCEEKNTCKSWIREDFAFEKVPHCPLCNSSMVRDTKMLPVLVNESTVLKIEATTTWRRRRGII